MNRLFSIITPNLNSEKYITRCLESVKRIIVPYGWEIEHLIIDGGSIDNSLALITNQMHPWQKLIVGRDLGIYDAMNKGLQMIRGDFFVILNSDDALTPEVLLALHDSLINNPKVEILLGGSEIIFTNGEVHSVNSLFSDLFLNMVPHPSLLFSTQPENERDYFDLRYTVSADYDYTLCRFLKSKSTTVSNRVLSRVFIGGFSEKPSNRLVSIIERELIRKKHKISSKFQSIIRIFLDSSRILVRRSDRLDMILGAYTYTKRCLRKG